MAAHLQARCLSALPGASRGIGAQKQNTITFLFQRRSAVQPATHRSSHVLQARVQTRDKQTSVQSKNASSDQLPGALNEAMGSSPASYLPLVVAYTAAALPVALFPNAAADFLFGADASHTALTEPLFRLLATGLVGASSIAYALKLATAAGDAGESKAERLNLSLIAFATFNTLFSGSSVATASGVTLNTSPFLATALLMGATIFVAWGSYGSNSEYGLSLKRFGPLPAMKKVQDDTVGLGTALAKRDNVKSLTYAAFTVAFAAAGAGYIFAPEDTLRLIFGEASGGSNIFLWRLIGGAVLALVPGLTYTLKEAADQGTLSEPASKTHWL
ncbi:hypothetical protein WJX72_003185 [[Myrmecia] bisecta]|uniref:Uncharacterized protein n=1 Tax=[Myrmecia] bisecta TaxID=41462 RepID=A0AAW1PED1_9CHLO